MLLPQSLSPKPFMEILIIPWRTYTRKFCISTYAWQKQSNSLICTAEIGLTTYNWTWRTDCLQTFTAEIKSVQITLFTLLYPCSSW